MLATPYIVAMIRPRNWRHWMGISKWMPAIGRLVVLTGLVLVLSIGQATARQVDPKSGSSSAAPRGVDEKADSVLREMGRTLAAAKAFSFEASQCVDQVQANGQRIQL